MDETKFRNIQKIIQQQAREFALITIAADVSTAEGCAAKNRAHEFSNKHWAVVAEKHGYTREDFDYVEAANEAFNESIRVEENG
jgi:hypothetical protein